MEGRLVGGGEQPLPVGVLTPQAISLVDVHLNERYHSQIISKMTYHEIGVPAHQPLNTVQSNLAVYLYPYLHNLVSKELAGTVLTSFWQSKKKVL